MDRNDKIFSSLCYFSIFFAGFLFPLIIYFVTTEEKVKSHAKGALVSHLIPVFTICMAIVTFSGELLGTQSHFPFGGIALLFVSAILSFIIMIWNVFKGIQVLQS